LVYSNGEIVSSPNTIYWVQMPVSVGEPEKIELLKRDVLVVDCTYDLSNITLLKEKKDTYCAFFFNLDDIIKNSINKYDSIYSLSVNLAQFISRISIEKSIVHTNIIDEKLAEIYRNEGLFYLEKNFRDKSTAVSTVNNLIKPLFVYNNHVPRPSLRIVLYPEILYKVDIFINKSSTETKIIQGYLKDLSFNGMGIIINDPEEICYLQLKSVVQLRINAIKSILKIPIAGITRIDFDKKEIGINYDISNSQMVREETSNYLIKLIYNWMNEIIGRYGKIS